MNDELKEAIMIVVSAIFHAWIKGKTCDPTHNFQNLPEELKKADHIYADFIRPEEKPDPRYA